jgi:transcriptional regulator with XRE-family HTH domain
MTTIKAPTPGRLRRAMTALGWTTAILADQTGNSRSSARRWVLGEYAPPDDLLAWIEARAAHMRANPPPPPRSKWDEADTAGHAVR